MCKCILEEVEWVQIITYRAVGSHSLANMQTYFSFNFTYLAYKVIDGYFNLAYLQLLIHLTSDSNFNFPRLACLCGLLLVSS